MSWYHGTNQIIDEFRISEDVQGLNTGAEIARHLVYFADDPEVAAEYAIAASKKMYPGDHLAHEKRLASMLDEYNQLMNQNLYDRADSVCEAMERLDESLRNDDSGQCLYKVELFPKKTLVHDFKGEVWGNPGTEEIIQRAKDEKVDVLFVTNVIDQPLLPAEKQPMTMAIVLNCDCIMLSIHAKKTGITPEQVNRLHEPTYDGKFEVSL